MYYYSPSARGFYHEVIHGIDMPPDVVEVPDELHAALMNAQTDGKNEIVPGPSGKPILQKRPVEHFWETLRSQRNQLLKDSDWTQNADVPENLKAKWAPYRQALRDFPANTKDPEKATFPKAP